MIEKLYAIVDRRLPIGDQAAQLFHAGVDLALLADGAERQALLDWHARSNTIVLLEAPGPDDLRGLMDRSASLHRVGFVEPDLGNALTAIAFAPCDAARRLCRPYRLAF